MDINKDIVDLVYKLDYGETKDLLKTFMTLISGTLVLSITFAEKIVNLQNSSQAARNLLVACWISLIAALIFCGISMCFIAAYMGKVAYGAGFILAIRGGYLALVSWSFVILAGGAYVGALVCMMLAAIRSMDEKASASHGK